MTTFELVRWGAFALLGLLFAVIAVANLQIVLGLGKDMRRAREEGRNVSMIPFVGGFIGALGFAVSPSPVLRDLWWLPILLDPPNFLLLVALPCVLFVELSRRSNARRAGPGGGTPLQKAIEGCLLGTAIGDAMGLASEGLSRRRQTRMVVRADEYRFLNGYGMCSDDTEHACMLAQSLVVTGRPAGVDEHARAFASNFAWRLRFWLLGLPAGIGMATLRSILKLLVFFPPGRSGVYSAGNGPAMRSALIGVCFGGEPARMRALVRASTRITHTDPKAEHAALAVALAAHLATRGKAVTAGEFHDELKGRLGDEPSELPGLVARIDTMLAQGGSIEAFADSIGCSEGVSGYSMHTVPVALFAWLAHQGDYRAAVLATIGCGGDTDTVAAITGAIVGSRVGEEGIPAQWREDLVEWPRTVGWMRALARRLAAAIEGGQGQKALPLSLTALAVRNVFFLCIVLTHGFRRLLPPY